MSLIAYADGILLADTVGCSHIAYALGTWTPIQKLFVDKSNMFAFAIVGARLLKKDQAKVFDQVHEALDKYYTGVSDGISVEFLNKQKLLPEQHRNMMILTNTEVFCSDKFGTFSELEPYVDIQAKGTNAFAWAGAYHLLGDPLSAAEIAVKRITGLEQRINSINAKDLIPYVSTSQTMADDIIKTIAEGPK